MKKFGRLYPDAGYGGKFGRWLLSDERRPYNSSGNGSVMRVSPCAWFAESLEEAEALAERSAAVTHNHPEGLKGAKATAAAIYLIRTGEFATGTSARDIERIVQDDFQAKVEAGTVPPLRTLPMDDLAAFLESEREHGDPEKDKRQIDAYFASLKHGEAIRKGRIKEYRARIRWYLESRYGYDLSQTLDDIRPNYQFNETCQETVPEAIMAFLESNSFEGAIRNAVSLGGDADTLAAIAGGIAEVEYGIGHDVLTEAFHYLDDDLSSVVNAWLDKGLPTGGHMVKNSGPLDYHHWKPKGFSKPHTIKTGWLLRERQLARMRFGLWPEQMEDKWFAYYENGRICFHRSWTGHKIYEAEIQRADSGYTIPEITVERDQKIYRQTNNAEDICDFNYLVCHLTGLELESMPSKTSRTSKTRKASKKSGLDLLRDWSKFGRMMLISQSATSEINDAIKNQCLDESSEP